MIRIYRDRALILICHGSDWRRFLPRNADIVWVGYAHDDTWTWDWA